MLGKSRLLLPLLLLPHNSKGMDGCGEWEWRCGDKCIYEGAVKNTWPFLVVESERRGGKYSRGDDDNDNDNDGDNDNDDDNDDDDYDDDDDDEDPIEFHPLPPRQLT